MNRPLKVLLTVFLLCPFLSPSLLFAADPAKDPFYTSGHFISAPAEGTVYEYVDPFSGYLILVHTDIFLPGNGGLDLRIMRVYSSCIWGRRDTASPGLIAVNERSPLGIGWSMHMGIVRNPFGTGSSNRYLPNNPVVEMPDGSQHVLYMDKSDSTRFINRDLWIYKQISSGIWELTLTDGTVYTFEYNTNAGYDTLDSVKIAQVTSIKNPTRNSGITISYYKYNGYSYLKTITDSVGRSIQFNYNYTSHTLTSITAAGRTFYYYYQTISSMKFLNEVKLPVGNPWTYSYYTSTYDLQKVTFPAGGTITYNYSDISFDTGATNVKFRVVTQRTTGGRDINAGTWTYQYSSGGTSGDTTTITGPDGIKEIHKFNGWGNCPASGYCGNVWKMGLPISKETYLNSSLILSESFSWSQGTQISYDDVANANWSGTGGWVYDSEIYVPFLSSKNITRDGKTYATSYSNYDTYGNPKTISETGDKTRTTTRTYWYSTSKNIVKDKPSSETVSGSFPGTFTTNYTYDTNGYPTQISRYGVVTNYSYYSNGNLYTMTDANGNKMTYQWSNGRISKITNPIYYISRSINSNGTIASETNGRGYTTYFTYDGNLRLTKIDPSIGNPTYFTYPSDNSYKKESRGGYYIYYYYDGFERPSGTSDSKGITTDVVYKSYGQKDYTTSNFGDTVYYDYFERAIKILHKDNSDIEYSYSGSNVTVTDEATNKTYLTYNAFGSPDEKWLVNVKDSLNNNTAYDYNILGSITSISQGGISRGFSYDSKNFLISESHPEKGTITYTQYNMGNLKTKADSLGTTYYYYDGLNRLTKTTYGTDSVNFDYDNADNRIIMDNPSASIDYTYDSANRLTKKVEIIKGKTYTANYEYDGNDNITDIYYPSGRHVIYTYNSNNQVTSITGFGESITNITYYTTGTSTGLPKSFKYSNGLTTDITYNNRNLTTQIEVGTSTLDMRYGYDSRGNTTSITNYLDRSEDQTFTYDDLNRLETFNGSWDTGSFIYDSLGNRKSKKIGGVTTNYNYSNNRLTSTTGGEPFTFDYNNNGDLTSFNGDVLSYDRLHNLISYKQDGSILAEYEYDGDGMRVTKTSDGKTLVYHYDQEGKVISEDDGNGNFIADYIYLNGKLAAKIANDAFIPPETPTNLTATAVSSTQINLSWTDNSNNETGFKIERKIGSSGTYSQIATVSANVTAYSDTGLTPDTTYYYRVRAYNLGGDSAYSNEANATTSTTPQPDISVSPISYNFGNVNIGSTSAAQTFTVSNTGTVNLVIGTITLTGTNASEFSKPSDSCSGQTVAPSANCTVQVVFSPTSEGAKSANLSIPSNDPDTPTLNVSLSGVGGIQPVEGAVDLPKTGQTISYVARDDGDIQAGVEWPSPRFKDNGNGTITDNLTGLMWLKDANCVATHYPAISEYAMYGWLSWEEALSFILYVNAGIYPLCGAGYNDWRLPNVNELESLFNAGVADPISWLNQQSFINVQSFYYWTSTTHAYNTDWAWNWISGSSGAGISKSESLHLWPVRGTTSEPAKLWRTGQTINYSTFPDDGGIRAGVEWPSPRFTTNGDTTVRDNLTGLVWSPDAGTPTIGTCIGGVKTLQEALDYIVCLNNNSYLGHNDWRLPNRKELYSLIDFSQYSPALTSGHPFANVLNSGYWSSTTDNSNTSNAWMIGIGYGAVGKNSKGSGFYVWPVRGGIQLYFEEDDPAITYTGTWNTYTCPSCSGGALKYSGQTGAKADFSFNGTGIKWIVTKASIMGMAKVYLDGLPPAGVLIDLYSPTPQYQVVLQKTGLTPGTHTIAIEVSGQKNPSSTGYYINIDAFEVVP
jgi:YD repeat-containing protein